MRSAYLLMVIGTVIGAMLAGCVPTQDAPQEAASGEQPIRFDYERLMELNSTHMVKRFSFKNSDFHVNINPYEMYEIDPETGKYRSSDTFTVYGAQIIVQSPKTRSMTKRGQTMEEVFAIKYQNLTPSSYTYPLVPSCEFWDEPDDEYPVLHGRCYEEDRDLVVFLEAGGEIDVEEWMTELLDTMVR